MGLPRLADAECHHGAIGAEPRLGEVAAGQTIGDGEQAPFDHGARLGGTSGELGRGTTVAPMPEKPSRNLALELVRVTESAALAASRWVGRGDKNGVDGAAVDAMRTVLASVPMNGVTGHAMRSLKCTVPSRIVPLGPGVWRKIFVV